MKSYRDCEIKILGSSKYSALTMTGNTNAGVKADVLKFGLDAAYTAYIVDEYDVEIGDHYEQVATFIDWLRIYDDKGLTAHFEADTIHVYRAGDAGCIIKIIG